MYRKELEIQNPLVQHIGAIAGEDANNVKMLSHIENRTEFKNLPIDSELRLIHNSIPKLVIVERETGTRLIVRDGAEMLVPKPARTEQVKNLHKTHGTTDSIWYCRQGGGSSGLN